MEIKLNFFLLFYSLVWSQTQGVSLKENGGSIDNNWESSVWDVNSQNQKNELQNRLGHLIGQERQSKLIIPSFIQELISNNNGDFDQDFEKILTGVSNECMQHNLHWARTAHNLTENWDNKNVWALHLIDAWGKVPEGILSGHVNAMGDFDECIGIEVNDIEISGEPDVPSNYRGKYCTTFIAPVPVSNDKEEEPAIRSGITPEELLGLILLQEGVLITPSVAVCFPSSCSDQDISLIMINGFKMFKLDGVIRPIVQNCFTNQKPDFDAGDYSVFVLLGVIFSLCGLSTILDIIRDKTKKPSKGLQYLLAFSVYTNTTKWLSTNVSGDNLGCLHGMRFISTSWVILAHTWYMVTFIPMWNMPDIKLVYQDWGILTVLNATLAVDTFFVISGLLVAFNVLKMLDKSRGHMNVPMFYLHRYLRITPTYAILIGIMATILPYWGSGPFWTIIDRWAVFCEKNWWTNLLYINNFVGTKELCQGEAWYLANDMQFYIVSPLIIYPLWKNAKIGSLWLTLLTILSALCPALLIWHYDTTPTTIPSRDNGRWFIDIYIKPYARIQTFLVGIWVGYFLFLTKGKKFEISKLTNLCTWIIAAGVALANLYGIHPWFEPSNEIPAGVQIIYGGFNRMAWGICVGWVIFACCKGYGGWVNTFLSWKAFMPLGRTCFCAYLVSLHIQMIFHLSFRQSVTYSSYTMTNFYFAHLITSFGLGFFCTIIFESPFIQIEKLIFSPGGEVQRSVQVDNKLQGVSERNGIFYNKTETIIGELQEKGD